MSLTGLVEFEIFATRNFKKGHKIKNFQKTKYR